MDIKRILIGTIGYAAITFPLAYVWHLVAFRSTYAEMGYFSREHPIIAFGFASILMQGAILSYVYPLLCRGMTIIRGAVTFSLVMGGYHWTMHVLAAAAKQAIAPLSTWFALETVYLAIQFGLAGLLMSSVYKRSQNPRNASV